MHRASPRALPILDGIAQLLGNYGRDSPTRLAGSLGTQALPRASPTAGFMS